MSDAQSPVVLVRRAVRVWSALPVKRTRSSDLLIALAALILVAASPAGAATPAASPARFFIAPTGSDQGPCSADKPCASFARAYRLTAARGGTVFVRGGRYPAGADSLGDSTVIPGSARTVFKCGSYATVAFVDPVFSFNPGAANIVVSGGCFHFHIVQVGLGGSCYCGGKGARANIVSAVTLDGVHMDSFDITGAQGLTIENSQVGPIDACFGIGQAAQFGAPPSAECDPNNPTEAYWATIPTGTLNLQVEPYIHSNGDLSGVTLTDNHFTGMQTKWASVFHQGGLLIWGAPGLVMSGNVFDHNAIYDIEFNSGTNVNGMTFQNNVLGAAYDILQSTNPPVPLPARQCQEGMIDNSGTSTYTNVLWRYNTFADCFNMGSTSTYNNVRFVGNLIGNYANCAAQTGISYSYNAAGTGASCQGGLSIPGSPFTSAPTGDLTIPPASPANNYVPCTTGDTALTTDINNIPRPFPSNTRCSAGAYEQTTPAKATKHTTKSGNRERK